VATLRNLLAFLVVFGAIACAADSSLLNLVMPDTQVLCGANVERIVNSPIGKEIGARVQDKYPEVQQVIQKAGFDPTRDLKEVLIAATGKGKAQKALVLVRGSFDPAKVAAAIARTGRVPQTYQGVQILENPSQTNGAFAFLDGTIAVGGDIDQVRAAIRRRQMNHTTLAGHLASQVAEISERYDIWVVSAASLTEMADSVSNPQVKQMGDMLKTIEQINGGLKFSDNLDLGVELKTHNQKEAQTLRDSLQLLIGMAAASQKDHSALDINALKLTADETTVRIAFTVTSEQLKKTYEMQMARMQQAAAPPKPLVQDTGVTIQSSERDMGTIVVSSSK